MYLLTSKWQVLGSPKYLFVRNKWPLTNSSENCNNSVSGISNSRLKAFRAPWRLTNICQDMVSGTTLVLITFNLRVTFFDLYGTVPNLKNRIKRTISCRLLKSLIIYLIVGSWRIEFCAIGMVIGEPITSTNKLAQNGVKPLISMTISSKYRPQVLAYTQTSISICPRLPITFPTWSVFITIPLSAIWSSHKAINHTIMYVHTYTHTYVCTA